MCMFRFEDPDLAQVFYREESGPTVEDDGSSPDPEFASEPIEPALVGSLTSP